VPLARFVGVVEANAGLGETDDPWRAEHGDQKPESEKEKIFECGYGKNSGLGLFLAREILAITNMTIRETGTPGTGVQFEIVVPREGYRRTSAGSLAGQ
jgi:hypothetical protein